jgi:L-threonylcarbamoyladenylate synthase
MAQASILPPTDLNIAAAAECIRNGGIVAYPTETVYGLAANPFDPIALAGLFDIKGRPPDKPVLLLIHDRSDLEILTSGITRIAIDLMDRFWPGPLTLLLPAREGLSTFVTSGSGTVAVRLSSCDAALALCQAAGMPITSTSANRDGAPPATTPGQAAELIDTSLGLVLDGHCEPDALPSTIVDATGPEPMLVRAGAISASDILH